MKILCSIYDKKAKLHENYMVFDHEPQAVKAFKMMCDENKLLKQWPEDYVLCKVANLNPEDGTIKEQLEEIIQAASLVPTPERPKTGTTEKK